MDKPSQDVEAAWTGLIAASKTLLEEIEAALKAADLAPLTWYDVLLEVEKAGDDGIRPYELQKRLLLPQYGVSRLLDRIAAAGLITRESYAADKRGQVIRLTPAGLAMRRRIWPVYAAFLNRRIGERLTGKEAVKLRKLLKKLG